MTSTPSLAELTQFGIRPADEHAHPFDAAKPLRAAINVAARRIANRFLNTYAKIGPHPIHPDTLDWHRTLQACRIMTDLTTWRAAGLADANRGKPQNVVNL